MHSIAIIGAGPAGCYCAQALAKALPDARIDILDARPVPYGLIRYGVAPDHQGTKAVIRQFERLFERQGVQFFGNVTLGRDVTLEALREMYDAVVLATGLDQDRKLGVPGDDLPGVLGSGVVTRAWNDAPDSTPPQIGPRVVVIGNGNVAVDLVRLLAKTDAECEGSDLTLTLPPVTRIDVVGRSPAEAAKFDPVMLKELGRLGAASIQVHGAEGEGKVIEALATLNGHAPEGARCAVHFHFGWVPEAIEGDTRVTAARFARGAERLSLPCDTVLTAIGFDGSRQEADVEGRIAPGLYATGWARRGPRGTIPENRADAMQVAATIAADLGPGGKPGRDALAPLVPQAVGYAGWQRIDEAERAAAPEGRVRAKIRTRVAMLALAQRGE